MLVMQQYRADRVIRTGVIEPYRSVDPVTAAMAHGQSFLTTGRVQLQSSTQTTKTGKTAPAATTPAQAAVAVVGASAVVPTATVKVVKESVIKAIVGTTATLKRTSVQPTPAAATSVAKTVNASATSVVSTYAASLPKVIAAGAQTAAVNSATLRAVNSK